MKKTLCRFLPARWLRFGLLALALLSAVSVSGDEAKLGTVISGFPYTVTASGVYVLQADNLSLNLADGAAITVACDNVTIDLNGHTLGNAAGAGNYATGVLVQGRSNVTVRNGSIKGCLTGVYLSQAANPSQSCLVEEMNLSGNLTSGVCVEGTNNIVRGCQIERTGGSTLPGYDMAAAISIYGGANRVLDCDISDVGANGVGILFSLGADHFAVNNRLSEPAAFGLWYDYSASGKYARNLVSGSVGQAYVGGIDAGQNMVDANNNGVDDDWEMKVFGDLTHTNLNVDTDGDGLTDLQEYQQGTNPTDFFNGHPPTLTMLGGDGQTAYPGSYLALPLAVSVANDDGTPLANASVTFTLTAGSGQFQAYTAAPKVSSPLTVQTNAKGKAQVFVWVNAGSNSALSVTAATAGGAQAASVTFTAQPGSGANPVDSPFTPTNLVATANPDGSVDMTWEDHDDQTPVDIYFERPDGTWEVFDSVPAGVGFCHVPFLPGSSSSQP